MTTTRARGQYERHDGHHELTGLKIVSLHDYTWSRGWIDAMALDFLSREKEERILAERADDFDHLDESERRFYGCSPEARELAEKEIDPLAYGERDWDDMMRYYRQLAKTAEKIEAEGKRCIKCHSGLTDVCLPVGTDELCQSCAIVVDDDDRQETTTLYVIADDDWTSEPLCLAALRQELEQYVQDCVDDPDRRSAAIEGLKIADDPQTIDQAVDLVQSVNHSIQAGSNGLTIRAVESDVVIG